MSPYYTMDKRGKRFVMLLLLAIYLPYQFIQDGGAWSGKPLVQVYLCLAFMRPTSQMLSGPSGTFGYTEQLAAKVGIDKGAALLLLCLCAREMGEDVWTR